MQQMLDTPAEAAQPESEFLSVMSRRFQLFTDAAEKFRLQQRFVVMIGESDDLDTDNEKASLERAVELVRLGIAEKAIRVRSYWIVSQGHEDEHLTAQVYDSEADATVALEHVRQRWMRRRMEKLL